MLDRKIPPLAVDVDKVVVSEPSIHFLKNNIEVGCFNIGTQDVVHVEFIFQTGLSNHQNSVVPRAISELIGVCSKNDTSGKIIEKIDYYGAYLENSVNMDITTVSIYSLSEHVYKVLEILKDAFFQIVFNEKDLKVFLSNSAQKLKNDLERVEFHCLREFNRAIFGNHIYGKIIELSDFNGIRTEHLDNHYNSFFGSNSLSIVVSGKFNENEIIQNLNLFFGRWKKSYIPKAVPRLNSSIPMTKYFHKEEAIQSAVRIGKILNVEYGSETYFTLKVVNTVLGGYFGSRLMSNLREDKGITYGVNSSFINYDGTSFFVIASTVKAEATDLAIKEIKMELDRLCSEPIDDKELNTVKNYMMGSLMRALDGPFLIAEQYKQLHLRGRKMNHIDDFFKAIQQVSVSDILSVSKQFLNSSTFTQVVVGNKSNK